MSLIDPNTGRASVKFGEAIPEAVMGGADIIAATLGPDGEPVPGVWSVEPGEDKAEFRAGLPPNIGRTALRPGPRAKLDDTRFGLPIQDERHIAPGASLVVYDRTGN